MANAETAPAKTTKPRLVERYFLIPGDDKPYPRANPQATKVIHKWKETGDVLEMDLSKLTEEMKLCAIQFGISQVVGNAYGGETDASEAYDKGERRWETILSGQWGQERVVGDRTGDLVEAFAKAYSDAGKTVTDEWKKGVQEKIDSGEIDATEVKKNPKIKAALDSIKLARAQERAKKSAAAAADSAELPSV